MKTLLVYVILAALTWSMIVGVDLLGGHSLYSSIRSIHSVFATTTLQEAACIVIFVALPFVNVLYGALKRSRQGRP
ncbi:hypothetical protein [Paenibacillus tengchongensis]|uniref:hypothetical protein n=1 Tax=Paenibacillus tengchongensis TaxID=2608684 RepID=UPI00124D1577|nr:hypothetical protein [Paenibacillus tengchongensis]